MKDPVDLVVPSEAHPTTLDVVSVGSADDEAHASWTSLIRRLFGR